jgi:hypothetical protein
MSAAPADEPDADAVKAVRAVLSAKKEADREELFKAALTHGKLDWAAFKKGVTEGPYYQKPLVTEYGERHSGKHFGTRLRGQDGKERGFSLYVPEKYDAKDKIPVLVYLHHNSYLPQSGAERAGVALLKFRKACEQHGVLFVAPYTSRGAEWWTPEGRRLVEWTLRKVKERYSIDENRVALMGALDGADGVWYLAQEMPGVWSSLLPMTADPYETAGMIRPLYLGTLDRMPILMGVAGQTKTSLEEKNAVQFLGGLKPLFDKGMKVTTAVYPRAKSDFHYLLEVQQQALAFVLDKKRAPMANEVDIECDLADGQRALWLENLGVDAEGVAADNFPTTVLRWKPPERKAAKPKIGVNLQNRDKWEIGVAVQRASGAALAEGLTHGDILLEVDDTPIHKVADVKPVMEKHTWGEEVRLLVARMAKPENLESLRRRQRQYMRFVERRRELMAKGEPIPLDLRDQIGVGEEEEEEEEEDEGDTAIEISDGEPEEEAPDEERGPAAGRDRKKLEVFVFERFVYLRRPEGKLVRADFGANWDPTFRKAGVRLRHPIPGSLADRSGFKEGDVIVAVGDQSVEKVRDVQSFFEDFRFEKEPEGERFVEFTVKRQAGEGQWDERTVTVAWDPVHASRVDARWDKREKTLHVLARHAKGFTIYFSDEHIAPGEPFHLYINGVPFQDLADPASRPDYPKVRPGSDPVVADDLHRMRKRRAKVEGWEPDLEWALRDALEQRDRTIVVGAKRSFDLEQLKPGFEASKKKAFRPGADLGRRVKEAYDRHRAQG